MCCRPPHLLTPRNPPLDAPVVHCARLGSSLRVPCFRELACGDEGARFLYGVDLYGGWIVDERVQRVQALCAARVRLHGLRSHRGERGARMDCRKERRADSSMTRHHDGGVPRGERRSEGSILGGFS